MTMFRRITADTSTGSRPMADLHNNPLSIALTATWTHTFSATLINEAKGNFTRFASNQITASSATNWGIPRVQVESYPFGNLEIGAPQGARRRPYLRRTPLKAVTRSPECEATTRFALGRRSGASRITTIWSAAVVLFTLSPVCSISRMTPRYTKALMPIPLPGRL